MKNVLTKVGNYQLIAAFAAMSLLLVWTTPVHAQEETPTPQDKPADSQNYDYVAKKSNNLTLLVRRSLQLYDESNDQITLSEAQIIYAETNIVRDLGSYGLDIGQMVSVPGELLAKYAQSSQSLSPSQIAAWDRYVRVAQFDLSNIQPSNATAAKNTEESKSDQPAADDQQSSEKAADQNKNENTNKNGGADWWWYAVLAAVILSLWYWLRDRDTKPAQKSSRKK